jgi:DNA-binding response OmpR family regulator
LLRQDPATRESRILIVTAAAYPDDTLRALGAGADDVLTKPCTPEDVVQAVVRLTRNEPGHASSPAVAASAAPPNGKRAARSRSYQRHFTTTPPRVPPELHCPSCVGLLAYQRSHVGGVSERFEEQWDYYACGRCGTFRYRHRTRKLTHETSS